MKTKKHLARWLAVMLAFFAIPSLMAQGPGGLTSQSTTQEVCIGIHPYAVVPGDPGNTFLWEITPGVSGTNWSITSPTSVNTDVEWLLPGTYNLTLTETDGEGCSTTQQVVVTVNALPVVNFVGTYGPYCVDGAVVTLDATPAGGTFSGNGVTGNQFDPSVAGVGTHTITYTYSDGNGCENSASIDIIVNDLPVVNFVGTYGPYCVDGAVVTLDATPAGGTFSGNGVTGNQFDPSVAGVGTHTITYTYSDGNGCENSASIDIIVNDLPVVNFVGTYGPYCVDGAVVTLDATPVGGTFSGNGVTGNQFDPSVAGVGTHTITYTYTDGNSCENSATIDIIVNDLPVVNFVGTYGPYCVDGVLVTLDATPAGGTFSGNGVTGNQFDPSVAGIGTHTITYTYTDGNGCENSASIDIIVNDLPVVNFVGTYGPYCVDGAVVTLDATPAGGTFSGNGVTGNQFDPSVAGVGTHTITYTYSDGNGCENSATIDIIVNDLPVVTIDPIGPFCSNDAVITLTATPVGGTFSGPGVTGNQFDPTVAGPGSHIITYTYTDTNGCTGVDTETIVVTPAPTTSPIWHN